MASSDTPFGRVVTAMITPMTGDRAVDYDGAARLAVHLVDNGSDALVISGTTGESGTTSDAEKAELVRAVVDAVAGRAKVLAGVGTNNTAHSIELSAEAVKSGADALLIATPYYSKPSQDGLRAHFEAIADSTDLPVMLYDIPGRSALPIETDTLIALSAHPQIVAVKDAKNDLVRTSWVQAKCDLINYCGSDEFTLPMLAVGAVGTVSVASHLAGTRLREMIDAFFAGDVATARRIHLGLLPLFTGLFRVSSPTDVKAALTLVGLPAGPVRLPLVDATDEQIDLLKADLAAANISVGPRA
ncbi:MAG: 4-hydroxy-tetrahydrodipicolinate synthase [Mycobacteriales bacterium]